ncbi:MAG: matrixin family metalloprotease [Sandaracinaceae bacterium]
MYRRNALSLALAVALAGGCASSTSSDEGFEGFRASLDRETFVDGVYLFDGDLAVESDKRLREVYTVRGLPGVGTWGPTERHQLRYCVSDTFADHDVVVSAMQEATAMWEAAADVDFHHLPSEDARCHANNDTVAFDVRPVFGQPYLARAFFPSTGRTHRNLLINMDSLNTATPSLNKVLEHQLGHALGLDHTRLGTALNGCEPGVMGDLACADGHGHDMTDTERARARQLYGAPSELERPAVTGDLQSRVESGLVAAGMTADLPPVGVQAGSRLLVELYGSGDLDLYVRFDEEPTLHTWDCRPFGPDATERCEMSVPANAHYAFVSVRSAEPIDETRLTVDEYVVDLEHVTPPAATYDVPQLAVEYERQF